MESNDLIDKIREKNMQKELQGIHYYGDKVRFLFLTIAIIMLVLTPFFLDKKPLPASSTVFGVLVLAVLAGLTNPRSKNFIVFDFIVSMLLVIVFGYETIDSYKNFYLDTFFFGNLVLAILSIFALYFSSKTLRGGTLNSGNN